MELPLVHQLPLPTRLSFLHLEPPHPTPMASPDNQPDAMGGLGAFHGLNPGTGWLFAVALETQEGRRNAVWFALLPLTIGHSWRDFVPSNVEMADRPAAHHARRLAMLPLSMRVGMKGK